MMAKVELMPLNPPQKLPKTDQKQRGKMGAAIPLNLSLPLPISSTHIYI